MPAPASRTAPRGMGVAVGRLRRGRAAWTSSPPASGPNHGSIATQEAGFVDVHGGKLEWPEARISGPPARDSSTTTGTGTWTCSCATTSEWSREIDLEQLAFTLNGSGPSLRAADELRRRPSPASSATRATEPSSDVSQARRHPRRANPVHGGAHAGKALGVVLRRLRRRTAGPRRDRGRERHGPEPPVPQPAQRHLFEEIGCAVAASDSTATERRRGRWESTPRTIATTAPWASASGTSRTR